MIISGGSRRGAAFFAKHLMRADENEQVTVTEIRGLAALDVREAFREMEALASASRCQNYFYHANLNPRENEVLSPQQWEQAVDTLERNLGLEGHSRFVVQHEKHGRIHQHVIWSRIDPDTLTAVSDSKNYAKHELTARELEREFGHERVQGVHVELDGSDRADRRPENWETFRGHKSGIDPQAVKAELTQIWQHADNGAAFRAAIEERGYVLARGDRRDFVVIDPAGDDHSLSRRLSGVKAAAVRARMADIDRESLPSVTEARILARSASEAAGGAQAAEVPLEPAISHSAFTDALSPLDEHLAANALSDPGAPMTAATERELAARFGDPAPAPQDSPEELVEVAPGEHPATETIEPGQHPDTAQTQPGDHPQRDEVKPGDRADWESQTPHEAGSAGRVTPWGTAWRRFADRMTSFAEAVSELYRDDSTDTAGRSWTYRVAHLAVTGAKAVMRHDAGQTWTAFVEEGRALVRDWTGQGRDSGSWQERTGRASPPPDASPATTRDPFEAMGDSEPAGDDPPDTPTQPPPEPEPGGPELG